MIDTVSSEHNQLLDPIGDLIVFVSTFKYQLSLDAAGFNFYESVYLVLLMRFLYGKWTTNYSRYVIIKYYTRFSDDATSLLIKCRLTRTDKRKLLNQHPLYERWNFWIFIIFPNMESSFCINKLYITE